MTRAMSCFLLAAALACSQDISVVTVLFASGKSDDADFAGSVILLVRHDQQATIGLFVNRPLNIPLSEVYPDLKGAQLKLYAGGPVTVGIRALYRSRAKPAGATTILDDVFMISTKTVLGKMTAAEPPSTVFRVYAGFTGWSPGQLQDEVARGLWHILPGEGAIVFDPHPETVWSRLAARLPRADNHFKMRNMLEKSSVQARKPA
jgi:putative transcriptional regulator